MSARRRMTCKVLIAAACLFGASRAVADVEQLQKAFQTPPDDARMMARWWWFGPAVTKQGIEGELKAMKAGGFGGVELQPTYPLALDGPNGEGQIKNLKLMSPEFLQIVGHAAATCKELGLRFDLTLGSGWPYGGPQFSASEGAGRLETQVVQAPAGATAIAVPALQAGRSVIVAFAGPAGVVGGGGRRGGGGGGGGNADVRNLKEVPVANNTIQLPANFKGGEVVLFLSGRTGMQVKRPAFGGEGLVIDHLSAKVVDKFIREIAEPELKACGANTPYAIFCDSLEVGGENWTDDFLAEFQKRRGYDLRPLLPALLGNLGDRTDDIRHDYAQTVTDVFNDNFNAKFAALAKKYNTRFRIQGYGSPPAALFSYAFADLPEGEAGGNGNWRSFRSTRYAASASHLLGKPVTSSETFTWLHQAPFRATPLDIKGQADTEFLDGINQFICHGWPYTGNGASYPGWSFYAAAVFDDKNPWYIAMPEINNYIARTSHLLREGRPANQVALYMSDADVWSRATTAFSSMDQTWRGLSGVAASLLDAGYTFDGVDDGMLALKGAIVPGIAGNPASAPGALVFGDVHYKAVVLPRVEQMPLATAEKLEAFAKAGGILVTIGAAPSQVPGYKATAEDQEKLKGIMQRLFKEEGAPGIVVETEGGFAEAVAAKMPPDLRLDSAITGIGHVHRHIDGGELYFVANTNNQKQTVKATFANAGLQKAEEWDPLTGSVRALVAGDNTLSLELEPYGSTFVLWTNRVLPAAVAAADAVKIDLSSGWSLAIDGKTIPLEKLESWTELPNLQNFSGTAAYERKLTLTSEQAQAALSLKFSNGPRQPQQAPGGRGRGGGQGFAANLEAPVRDAAVVTINGKRAGAAWCPPYEVELAGLLKAGENTVRIEVANTAVNYLAKAGFPNYNYQAVNQQYGNRFQPQGTQLYAQPLPSGIIGSVELLSTK